MIRLIFYCFCISVVWTSPFMNSTSKKVPIKDIGGRIIGGEEAAANQFPWQVALYFTDGNNSWWFCGGGIISEYWILTAGHCVEGGALVEVYPGLLDLNEPTELIYSRELILHEGFDADTLSNDIGLLKLLKPLSFDDSIQPIALASEVLPAGTEVTVSGWGVTSDGEDATISDVLLYIHIRTIENRECEAVYGPLNEGIVCALWDGNIVHASCYGDSGGPIVLNADTEPLHVAIVSFGSDEGCAVGAPDGFTRTAYHREWIRTNSGV